MGVYVVVKRIVFISGGIAHTSFGGIGLGYLLGANPIIGALVFALGASLTIGLVTRADTSAGRPPPSVFSGPSAWRLA